MRFRWWRGSPANNRPMPARPMPARPTAPSLAAGESPDPLRSLAPRPVLLNHRNLQTIESAHAGQFATGRANARNRLTGRLECDRHVEGVGVKERCRVAHDRYVAMPEQEIAAPQL